MGPQNKVVALLLAVVLVCTSFAASAKEVNTSLSANPTATISTIDSIGTPLPNQAAGEVRGELWQFWIAGWSIAMILYTQYKVYFGEGVTLTSAGQDLYIISITNM